MGNRRVHGVLICSRLSICALLPLRLPPATAPPSSTYTRRRLCGGLVSDELLHRLRLPLLRRRRAAAFVRGCLGWPSALVALLLELYFSEHDALFGICNMDERLFATALLIIWNSREGKRDSGGISDSIQPHLVCL